MDTASKPFILYNTSTRTESEMHLIEDRHLRFYSCGPTVYSNAHIGNFRTFLTGDLIVRTARALGWRVTYATNITDVGHLTEDDRADAGGEDKMAKALKSKQGEHFVNVWDLARHYTRTFLTDWQSLNLLCETSEDDKFQLIRPRATEHIREQIQAIEQLIATGYAYETSDAVYFSVAAFANYGKLSGNVSAENLEEAVRDIVVDTNKRDPRDFALWKKDDKHLMQWFSPWGWGFPGWHLECSVMAMQYLGETFDLHGGGEDLTFPHHECEIAQSEALTGKTFANHWVHTRFLQVEGEKMSKSKGNFYTVHELISPESEGGKGYDPLALRFALLSGHYGKPFNFTFALLKDATKLVRRYQELEAEVDKILASNAEEGKDFLADRLAKNYDSILDAMLDNLNTPQAIALAHTGQKMIQGASANMGKLAAQSAKDWFKKVNDLLGFIAYQTPVEQKEAVDPEVAAAQLLAAEIDAARAAKDYARSDELRQRIAEMGFEVLNTKEGTKIRKQV